MTNKENRKKQQNNVEGYNYIFFIHHIHILHIYIYKERKERERKIYKKRRGYRGRSSSKERELFNSCNYHERN